MQETSGVSENSLAITSPYFQELLEISNVEEVATQNDLTVEENLALLRKNAFRTNQVIIRMIQEQVVALEERNVLKQENANLRQDNVELKQKDAVKDQEIKHLKRKNAEVKQENVVRDQEIKHLKRKNAEVKQENVVRDQEIKHLKRENAEVKQENVVRDQEIKNLKRVDVEKDRKIEILNRETGVLNNQVGNLKRENAEFRERDIVRIREMRDLEDGIYNPMRQSILSRIETVRESFFTYINRIIEDRGKRQQLKLLTEVSFAFKNPVLGLALEVGNNEVSINTLKKLNEIKNEISEKPFLIRDLEFKRNYESSIIALENAVASFERQMMRLPRYSPLEHSVAAEYRFSQM